MSTRAHTIGGTWRRVGVAAVLAWSAAALAWPPPGNLRTDVSIAESLRLLGSDSVLERASASVALGASDRVGLRDIEAALLTPDLSPEQRLRLERVGFEKFSSTPRGALGIRFQQRLADGPASGTVIDATYEGFDAHRVLRPGDVIYSIDGQRVLSIDDGKRAIQSHDPGERLTLRIFRDGEPLLARVTLGSLRALDQISPGGQRGDLGRGQPAILRGAFEDRLARSCGRGALWPETLDLRPFEGPVEPHANEIPPDAAQFFQPAPDLEPDPKPAATPASIAPGGVQRPVTIAATSAFDLSGPARRMANLQAIQEQLRIVQNRMSTEQRILADVNRPNAERQAAQTRLDALRRQQALLNNRYAEVKVKLAKP